MAINNYIRPSLEVYQMLEVTESITGDHMAACIVGADYDLYRYGYEDLTPTAFNMDGGSQIIALDYTKDPSYKYELDTDSIKVYAENLCATVGAGGNITTLTDKNPITVSDTDVFTIETTEAMKCLAWSGGGTAPADGYASVVENALRSPQIGDTVVIAGSRTGEEFATSPVPSEAWKAEAAPDDYCEAVITELVGAPIAAAVAAPTTTATTGITAMSTEGSVNNAAVTEDTTFQAAITAIEDLQVTFTITDSAGLFTTTEVTVTASSSTPVSIPLANSGITLKATLSDSTISTTGPVLGDAIYVAVTAQTRSTTIFTGLKLSKPAVALGARADYQSDGDGKLAVSVYQKYSGILTGLNPTVSATDADGQATKVKIEGVPTVTINGTAAPFINTAGDIFLQYRVMLVPDDTDDLFTITSVSDIQANFGTIAPENDIAYGCYCALKGSGGRTVYALRVSSQTVAAYQAALNKVAINSATYSFVPLNENTDIIKAVVNYVEARSDASVKLWCRALVGIDNPGAYMVASRDNNNQPIFADIAVADSGYILQLTADTDFSFTNISFNGTTVAVNAGDLIELAATGAKYEITQVANTVVYLASGPTGGVSNSAIRIWKADTATNAGEYVSSIATAINSRRATLVWCDNGTTLAENSGSDTVVVSNKFLAAEVAGIASAVVPQAPITRTEISCITAAVRMYTKYTQTQLDNIAKNGVMIITQDAKNQPCYIRHQLTTETDKGALYYEESYTRNLDNISYAIVDALAPYYGKVNVTTSVINSIDTDISTVLNTFTQNSPDTLIGPSLISWEDLEVTQDSTFKDMININVKLYLPGPLNVIKAYVMGYTATITI